MAIGHLRWVASFVLVFAACRKEAATETPAEPPAPQAKVSDAPPKPAADHPTVDVDLSPSGIGATIRGPDGAKAAAHDDYVTVDADPDFHMEVHRGKIDLLAEKAEIVKRWGPAFRRFVRDDKTAVVYETAVANEPRYHFLTWGEKQGLDYFCRSDKHGVGSVDAVQRMLDGCHTISVHEKVVAGAK